MNAQDQAAVARVMARQEPQDWDHHADCPQHPWNNVTDEVDECECLELAEADRINAAEAKHGGDR